MNSILAPLYASFDDGEERAGYFREASSESTKEFRRTENAEVKAVDEDEKTIVYTITSPAIDRYQEIVDPNGLDLKNFRRSKRTVFWNHDYNRPIGRSLWEKRDGDKWIAKVQFADGATDFATDIWNLAKGGFIGMTSIGFIPKQWSYKRLKDIDGFDVPNKKEGEKDREYLVHDKAELIEWSVVGIGANPDAYQLEKALGVVTSSEVQSRLAGALVQAQAKATELRVCELEACGTDMNGKLSALEANVLSIVEPQHELIKSLLASVEALEAKVKEIEAKASTNPVETTAKTIDPDQLGRLVEQVVRGVVSRKRGRLN